MGVAPSLFVVWPLSMRVSAVLLLFPAAGALFEPRRRPSRRHGAPAPAPPRPPPIGPSRSGKPEVVAFYGEDAAVAGHPEDTCTPDFWLDFPPDTVTTIIMQGW